MNAIDFLKKEFGMKRGLVLLQIVNAKEIWLHEVLEGKRETDVVSGSVGNTTFIVSDLVAKYKEATKPAPKPEKEKTSTKPE